MSFKSSDGAAVRKVLLSLDDATVAIFEKAGDGNRSLGARIVAQEYVKPRMASAPEPESKFSAAVKRRRPQPYNPEEPLEETAETAAKNKLRDFRRGCEKVMKVESLTYDGKDWKRDGSRVDPLKWPRLIYSKFPQLKEYADTYHD